MKRLLALVLVLMAAVATSPAAAEGYVFECDDEEIVNGVPFTVALMRSGFTYTATAIGLDGFDPIIAVFDEEGEGTCNDNSEDAAEYGAELPTSGEVDPSEDSAQVLFSHNDSDGFQDMTIVVGSASDDEGEFVLILEGMAATDADGFGDPFFVSITEDMVEAEVPLSVYMFGVSDSFDPLFYLGDFDDDEVVALEDEDGNVYGCDDAGNEELCWGESEALDGSFVSRSNGRETEGDEFDAMMVIETEGLDVEDGFSLFFVMTSYQQQSFGDYVLAFHAGVQEP